MIILLTGQPESGKTTLALELPIKNKMIIDGDDLRTATQNFDYSLLGRKLNIHNAHTIALWLEAKGFTPIVALVNPYMILRDELKRKTEVVEFYLTQTNRHSRDKWHVTDFEINPRVTQINTEQTITECVEQILYWIGRPVPKMQKPSSSY